MCRVLCTQEIVIDEQNPDKEGKRASSSRPVMGMMALKLRILRP